MRLAIDMPEHHYNNIMAFDSVSLGRVPYKGIIMYAINAIKHGKVLDQEQTDKNFTKADIDAIVKAINAGWELRVNEVLDKLRAEILDNAFSVVNPKNTYEYINVLDLDSIEKILDKYKTESEDKTW